MPSFSKLFLAFSLAFAVAPFASAVPFASPEEQTQTDSFSGISYETGIYNASDPLSKRDVPAECLFGGRANGYYRYIKLKPEKSTACIGYDNFGPTVCSQDKRWGIDNIGDILLSLNLLVTKDGWLSTAESGRWVATFSFPTTAFANRDTKPFVEGLVQIEKQPSLIWWSRDADYAAIIRDGNTCR
ncbi:hypothetical protein VE03_07261 [Pseudogymnoascus sp. 23342-1-I1]|nr:hypothetical protein VE03_07261 [Pseudogymnoascus sp. 23342-1-I1]